MIDSHLYQDALFFCSRAGTSEPDGTDWNGVQSMEHIPRMSPVGKLPLIYLGSYSSTTNDVVPSGK